MILRSGASGQEQRAPANRHCIAADLDRAGARIALLRPVNPIVALLQGAFGIVGIATSGDGSFYFGVQCILIGYLVIESTFLPRTIGVLMVLAGIAQLLFFSTLLPAAFTHKFASIGYVTDGVGEIAMALWLLIMGVNPSRWLAAASRTSVAA